MKYLGNSIVGDDKYKKKFKRIKDINPFLEKSLINLNRQFLHAKTIGFFTQKRIRRCFLTQFCQMNLKLF